jgi:hypothetical protein
MSFVYNIFHFHCTNVVIITRPSCKVVALREQNGMQISSHISFLMYVLKIDVILLVM